MRKPPYWSKIRSDIILRHIHAAYLLNEQSGDIARDVSYNPINATIIADEDGVIGGDFDLTAGAVVTLTGSGDIRYRINHIIYETALDTAIVLEDSGNIAQGKYGAWRIIIDISGDVTTQDTGAAMAFDNAQDAMLNLSAVVIPPNTATLGYLTVTKSDGAFNIGTTNLNAGNVTTVIYDIRGPKHEISGLTAPLGSSLMPEISGELWEVGTIDAKRNGVILAQIGPLDGQIMDDADTILTLKAGGWLFVVDLAGTGVYALAADGAAGSVSTMSYADSDAVSVALDALSNQLPEMFVPVGRIILFNDSEFSSFTADIDDWSEWSATTTTFDASVSAFGTIASRQNSIQGNVIDLSNNIYPVVLADRSLITSTSFSIVMELMRTGDSFSRAIFDQETDLVVNGNISITLDNDNQFVLNIIDDNNGTPVLRNITGPELALNQWRHFCVSYINGQSANFYIDGVKTTVEHAYDFVPALDIIASIGGNNREYVQSPLLSFVGLLNYCYIYNTALSDQEVVRLRDFPLRQKSRL